MSTDDGHKVSVKKRTDTIMDFCSISTEEAHFNITIIQVSASTTGYGGSEVDHFYKQL